MEKTLINQAVKNAVGQESCENTSVQEAEKTDPAALSAREFEDFLASIVTGVIQNVVDVRAGNARPWGPGCVLQGKPCADSDGRA